VQSKCNLARAEVVTALTVAPVLREEKTPWAMALVQQFTDARDTRWYRRRGWGPRATWPRMVWGSAVQMKGLGSASIGSDPGRCVHGRNDPLHCDTLYAVPS
jgi:hypothetical protein